MTEQRKPVVDAGFKLMNLTHKAALRADRRALAQAALRHARRGAADDRAQVR